MTLTSSETRGAGPADAVRSLIISSKLLGTREFVVIHHSDCGMLTFTSQELQKRLTEETGADASGIEFLTFADLEESVVEDVRRIRESPFIADDIPVSGFVYDVGTGRLKGTETLDSTSRDQFVLMDEAAQDVASSHAQHAGNQCGGFGSESGARRRSPA